MAYKIIWSPLALDQLEKISDYISKDSDSYAAAVITEMIDSVERLVAFPRIGRRVPESDQDDLREILVRSWRLVYRIGDGRIDVVEIIHGAQRLRGG
jgi:addiction module RelE/StbE family toxin